MERTLRTTRPVMAVRTIGDIVAIESHPYDELVTAHNLYDLILATAHHGGDRKALTALRSPDPADVGCSSTLQNLENPACNDGLDNDGDGKIDFNGGPGGGTPDPQCGTASGQKETASSCGLGAEAAFALAFIQWARRRAARQRSLRS